MDTHFLIKMTYYNRTIKEIIKELSIRIQIEKKDLDFRWDSVVGVFDEIHYRSIEYLRKTGEMILCYEYLKDVEGREAEG